MGEAARFRVDAIDLFMGPPDGDGGPLLAARAALSLRGGVSGIGLAAVSAGDDPITAAARRRALALSRSLYVDGSFRAGFGHFAVHRGILFRAAADEGIGAPAAAYAAALIDRALLDALGRTLDMTFAEMVRENALGMIAHPVLAPDLPAFGWDAFLGARGPAPALAVRQRLDAEAPDEAVKRTLATGPATLWLGLPTAPGRPKLGQLAEMLGGMHRPPAVVLDFRGLPSSLDDALALWRAVEAEPLFAATVSAIADPVADPDLLAKVHDLASVRPLIACGHDHAVDALPRARALGYSALAASAGHDPYVALFNLARTEAVGHQERGPFRVLGPALPAAMGLAGEQELTLAAAVGLGEIGAPGPAPVPAPPEGPGLGSDCELPLAAMTLIAGSLEPFRPSDRPRGHGHAEDY